MNKIPVHSTGWLELHFQSTRHVCEPFSNPLPVSIRETPERSSQFLETTSRYGTSGRKTLTTSRLCRVYVRPGASGLALARDWSIFISCECKTDSSAGHARVRIATGTGMDTATYIHSLNKIVWWRAWQQRWKFLDIRALVYLAHYGPVRHFHVQTGHCKNQLYLRCRRKMYSLFNLNLWTTHTFVYTAVRS